VALRAVVSVPLDVVLADANAALMRNVAGILAATLLLLIGAWFGAEVFVLRSVKTLLGVAKSVEAGDFHVRAKLGSGEDELARVGVAFDRMASALQAREAELQRAMHELETQAITDPLTGLHNRRYLWDMLGRELSKAGRSGKPVAVLMMDIDHFKRFNDTWGHEAGDLVLKGVAEFIRGQVRGSDIACRYGGEELVLILPEATAEIALERAQTIRGGVAALRLAQCGKPLGAVTLSVGVAVYPHSADEANALMQAADAAMYEAKKSGRNRVASSAGAEPVAIDMGQRAAGPFGYAV